MKECISRKILFELMHKYFSVYIVELLDYLYVT